MIPLPRFVEIAHAKGVPVIVDAAAEYDLRKFLRDGADLVLYSAHKFLRAPTAGILAGRRDLVRAAYLQNGGIGRGMKVGKEGIAGTIVALEAWARTDHVARRRDEKRRLDAWLAALVDRPGVVTAIVPDPTGNPVDRLCVRILPEEARTTAWDLAATLAVGNPVRRSARGSARARFLRARSLQSRYRGSPDRRRSPRSVGVGPGQRAFHLVFRRVADPPGSRDLGRLRIKAGRRDFSPRSGGGGGPRSGGGGALARSEKKAKEERSCVLDTPN